MKILIVDDKPYVRATLRDFLAPYKYFEVCGEAVDGIEAIAQAENRHPDVILMDLSMPNLNGAEAAVAIKKVLRHVQIILFTGYDMSAKTPPGVDVVVSKWNGTRELAKALQNVFVSLKNSDVATAIKPAADD